MSDDRTGTLGSSGSQGDEDGDPPLTEEQLASIDGPASLGPALLSIADDVQLLEVSRSSPQASLDDAWARLEARLGSEPARSERAQAERQRSEVVSEHPFASNETSGTRIRKGADVRPISAAKPPNRTMVYGAAVLAAAAAFALWVNKKPAPPSTQVTAKNYPPIVEIGDGGATRPLALGEVVSVPLEKTRWIAANGRLRVRISGGSSVRLLENGERVLLALDHGTIGADVTPVPGGEPLAIDLGRHRIAVHGTKFQVQRAEEAVDIAVTEGVVVWGWPKGAARTEGVEVKAGQIANFVWDTGGVVNDPISANGKVASALRVEAATTGSAAAIPLLAPLPHPGSTDPTAPKPVMTVAPITTSATTAATAPASVSETATVVPSTTASIAPPAGLSDTQAAHGLGKLQQGLEACVVGGTIGPKFTIETTMTVVVSKAGTVESWAFEPPLDPSLRECARKKTQGLTFPSADAPSTFKRPVVLGKK
ncbi:MAG: FecR domain-containing protein [Myxococcales bacterium]|nr:FecR domain-containing protein [Myxococcales bacterium]